jgi:hypothetical protein
MGIAFKMLYDFILIFALLLIIYFVFINKNRKEYSKLNGNSVIKSFIARYNLDMRKTSYKEVLNIFAFVNSFILAFTSALVLNIDKLIWKIIVSFIVVFVLIYALYEIAGRYLKNKEDKK